VIHGEANPLDEFRTLMLTTKSGFLTVHEHEKFPQVAVSLVSTSQGDPVTITTSTTPRQSAPLGRLTRRVAGASMLLIMASGSLAVRGATAQEAPNREVDEAEFVSLINQVRAERGAPPLTFNPDLERVARTWTLQMKAAGDISHNPNLAKQVTVKWRKLGENVGVGPNVPMLHDAFVKSPAHFKNLVDPAFDQIAVTIEYAGDIFYVTEQFMDTDDRVQGTAAKAPVPTDASAPGQLALQPAPKKPTKKPAKKTAAKKPATTVATKK
jgi:uncharacterized protein YkwD